MLKRFVLSKMCCCREKKTHKVRLTLAMFTIYFSRIDCSSFFSATNAHMGYRWFTVAYAHVVGKMHAANAHAVMATVANARAVLATSAPRGRKKHINFRHINLLNAKTEKNTENKKKQSLGKLGTISNSLVYVLFSVRYSVSAR